MSSVEIIINPNCLGGETGKTLGLWDRCENFLHKHSEGLSLAIQAWRLPIDLATSSLPFRALLTKSASCLGFVQLGLEWRGRRSYITATHNSLNPLRAPSA